MTLRDGSLITGIAVICTVSLGVLKANSIEFRPPLSNRKKTALSRLVMGSYTKLSIVFKEALLTADDPMLLIPNYYGRALNVQN